MTKLRVVDENGQDVSQEYTVRSRKQDEGYRKQGAREGRQRDFTGSRMENLSEVYNALTTAQCGYLMLLQCYAGFEGGTLVKADKNPMNKRDMMDVLQLGKKRQTFRDFLTACIDAGVITEAADGSYAINPRYHFKGAFEDQYVVKSYTAKLKRVYREVKATDIGLLYRMLPYVHYETNTLCANPFEQIPERVRPLSRTELAEAIGVTPQVITRCLPRMVFDGEYVIAQVKVGGKTSYMLNHTVFYRKKGEPDATLRRIFNVKDKR